MFTDIQSGKHYFGRPAGTDMVRFSTAQLSTHHEVAWSWTVRLANPPLATYYLEQSFKNSK